MSNSWKTFDLTKSAENDSHVSTIRNIVQIRLCLRRDYSFAKYSTFRSENHRSSRYDLKYRDPINLKEYQLMRNMLLLFLRFCDI